MTGRTDDTDNNRFLAVCAAAMVVVYLVAWRALGQLGVIAHGVEMSDIAERIVHGYGFSSPYLPPAHLPTTVSPPLYVWLTVPAYWALGVNTFGSRLFMQLLNLVFHCVTLVTLFRVCEKTLSARCARVFAVLFAVHPALVFLTSVVWENTLTTMLLSLLLRLLVFRSATLRAPGWLGVGLLMGTIALSNPVWSFGFPFLCVGAFYFNDGFTWSRLARGAAVVALGFALVTAPWCYRNYEVTGRPMFVRGMGGPEWFKGNNAAAGGGHGWGFQRYFLYHSESETALLRRMGEAAYNDRMMAAAEREIVGHPGRYALLTVGRVAQWWSGDLDLTRYHYQTRNRTQAALGAIFALVGVVTSVAGFVGFYRLRDRLRPLWPFWIYVFVLPIPYYLTIIGFRYQASLMPFLLVPAAWFVSQLKRPGA